mmetsp:Transcript_20572/g.61346  ORF Transcript_20572/g.61346 Transcript_20572/m.61346 type:complete len:608 (-) Transcript_20572:467-2290(-)|eukprot:CAMPEP_0119275354 /NCGR_PEP_ID=MMETSP1329-20130426/13612_1 /TAXON_ID=114041 /ORGANISM="Genus nov. species nov., Strain RCC1024" /LENGTH=607 /DNA_ID=CAMNT_0007275731 /DNA_START=320 /DNA_END=2143 /DNA_ORIENTATION=+
MDAAAVNPAQSLGLNDFVIVEELFRSATGAVYKVRRKSNHRLLVLKERRVAELGRRAPVTHEAELLRRLAHPHVIACHGYFWDCGRGCLYSLLDYAAGGDLAGIIQRRTVGDRAYLLPEEWIWLAFKQMCAGLAHLHGAGIVHRDVKALNILVAPRGSAAIIEPHAPRGLPPLPEDPGLKIADLGVSRQVTERTHILWTAYGTPLYTSPEICEGRPYDARTDIWSLGVVLYELCALVPPFTAVSLVALAQVIAVGRYAPLGRSYSPLLRDVVDRMLDVDPTHRPSAARLLRLCADRGKVHAKDLDDRLMDPQPNPSASPVLPAPAAPAPAAIPADTRRLEAALRRRHLCLANLRAAAVLHEDATGDPTPTVAAFGRKAHAAVVRAEDEVRQLAERLRSAVPGSSAATPAMSRQARDQMTSAQTACVALPPASPDGHHLGIEGNDFFVDYKARERARHQARRNYIFGGRSVVSGSAQLRAATRPRTVTPSPWPALTLSLPAPPAPRPGPALHFPLASLVNGPATPAAREVPSIPFDCRLHANNTSRPELGCSQPLCVGIVSCAPAWRVDPPRTADENARSDERLKRLRSRGAARRARTAVIALSGPRK